MTPTSARSDCVPERAPVIPLSCDANAARVLVVEDDPDLLRLIVRGFERAGFPACGATNGREALHLLASIQPDLMVTDIIMPEMEGIATIIEAKRLAPNMAVIAMSGGGCYGRTGNILQWAGELGADGAIAKPFSMPELLAVAGGLIPARPVAS